LRHKTSNQPRNPKQYRDLSTHEKYTRLSDFASQPAGREKPRWRELARFSPEE
jgi:hypothetical protein